MHDADIAKLSTSGWQPASFKANRWYFRPLFLLMLVLPNAISIAYFGFIASPIYVSTTSLVVFKPTQSGSNIESLLSGSSGGGSSEGAEILKDYIGSWTEYQQIKSAFDIASIFSTGDFVSRYGGLLTLFRQSDIALWHYYQSQARLHIDQESGIVTLKVKGHQSQLARTLATHILHDAVEHISSMNAQQEEDFIANARARKLTLEADLKNDDAQLAAYQAAIGVYDPQSLYVSDLALLNSLSVESARIESQYTALNNSAPQSPAVQNLSATLQALRTRISGINAGFPRLATQAATYEGLVVRRDNDVELLRQVDTAAQEANLNSLRDKYYLNIISTPSEPVAPELPDRVAWIAGVFVCSFLAWGLLR